MVKYILSLLLLMGLFVLGVVETAIALPLFSVGLVLFIVKNLQWWLRLALLLVFGMLWGLLTVISPAVFLLLLLLGTWLDRWLCTKITQRTSLFFVTLLISITVGLMRAAPITPSILVVAFLQIWLFWLFTRFLVTSRPRALLFVIPPRALNNATQ